MFLLLALPLGAKRRATIVGVCGILIVPRTTTTDVSLAFLQEYFSSHVAKRWARRFANSAPVPLRFIQANLRTRAHLFTGLGMSSDDGLYVPSGIYWLPFSEPIKVVGSLSAGLLPADRFRDHF